MLLKRREIIDFDPSNRAHRDAVRLFMQRSAWADSPLRFSHDPQFGSVAEQVKTKLLNWYVEKENRKSKA